MRLTSVQLPFQSRFQHGRTLNATDDDHCWFLLSIVLAGECNGRYGTRLVKLYTCTIVFFNSYCTIVYQVINVII